MFDRYTGIPYLPYFPGTRGVWVYPSIAAIFSRYKRCMSLSIYICHILQVQEVYEFIRLYLPYFPGSLYLPYFPGTRGVWVYPSISAIFSRYMRCLSLSIYICHIFQVQEVYEFIRPYLPYFPGTRGVWVYPESGRVFGVRGRVPVTRDRWSGPTVAEGGSPDVHDEHEAGACTQDLCQD